MLCGHNQRLAAGLRAMHAREPRVVVGFTQDVRHWLHLGDIFVGKPGPGSLTEALQCGLPVVLTRIRRIMPQECAAGAVRQFHLNLVGCGRITGQFDPRLEQPLAMTRATGRRARKLSRHHSTIAIPSRRRLDRARRLLSMQRGPALDGSASSPNGCSSKAWVWRSGAMPSRRQPSIRCGNRCPHYANVYMRTATRRCSR